MKRSRRAIFDTSRNLKTSYYYGDFPNSSIRYRKDWKSDVSFQASVIESSLHTAEEMVTEMFEEALEAAFYAKRSLLCSITSHLLSEPLEEIANFFQR